MIHARDQSVQPIAKRLGGVGFLNLHQRSVASYDLALVDWTETPKQGEGAVEEAFIGFGACKGRVEVGSSSSGVDPHSRSTLIASLVCKLEAVGALPNADKAELGSITAEAHSVAAHTTALAVLLTVGLPYLPRRYCSQSRVGDSMNSVQ